MWQRQYKLTINSASLWKNAGLVGLTPSKRGRTKTTSWIDVSNEICLILAIEAVLLYNGNYLYPIGSMGLVYLPTFIYHKNQLNVGKYTGPMDRMGYSMTIDMSHNPTRPDDWQVWRYFCHRRWGKGTQWTFFWKNLKQMWCPQMDLLWKFIHFHPFLSISLKRMRNFTWFEIETSRNRPCSPLLQLSFDVIQSSCHSWSLGPSVNLHLFRSAKEKFWDRRNEEIGDNRDTEPKPNKKRCVSRVF